MNHDARRKRMEATLAMPVIATWYQWGYNRSYSRAELCALSVVKITEKTITVIDPEAHYLTDRVRIVRKQDASESSEIVLTAHAKNLAWRLRSAHEQVKSAMREVTQFSERYPHIAFPTLTEDDDE